MGIFKSIIIYYNFPYPIHTPAKVYIFNLSSSEFVLSPTLFSDSNCLKFFSFIFPHFPPRHYIKSLYFLKLFKLSAFLIHFLRTYAFSAPAFAKSDKKICFFSKNFKLNAPYKNTASFKKSKKYS